MIEKIRGVLAPAVTPFDDEKLSMPKLEAMGEFLANSPLKGLFVLGSNGEAAHMDDTESLAVLRAYKKTMPKGKTLMAGIPRQSAYVTIEFGKRVEEIGVDCFSVLTPHYFVSQMTDAAFIDYYTRVADALSTPILLYNVPKFAAGVTLSETVIRELSRHPNIIGMKDSSVGNIQTYLKYKSDSFAVLSGTINTLFEGLEGGAYGGIVSMANYLPEATSEVCSLYWSGDKAGSKALADRLVEMNKKGAGKLGIPGTKAALRVLGVDAGEGRSPLLPCTPEQVESIRNTFIEYGYLHA
ncbi:dihydrodipicolinate synthase family protein [Oscillospiraceae bacterium OttesenSCG-928-G22]|nr:dihydrodipicolinate synthase family protein [Oscillospiraceae bacterium OttesenSCG-928-G22]